MQIDGLSRVILEQGLASGHMPFLKRLLRHHGYHLEPMTVGLPTSTPAFQMAAMYGVRPDIPGFHYYDREARTDIHFPRPGHAARVEAKHAAGRRGILHGGSAYGCVFTGGADNNLFSFTSLTRPSGRGLLCLLSPFVVVGWVCVKNLLRTTLELVRAVSRFVAHPVETRQGWRWLTIQIGFSVWVRGFFTLAVCRDLYAGTPAVYVNYLDYDVAAHAFGPRSRQALLSLRRVDRAIRQLWRVMRRVPEHRYDLYILADHGQSTLHPLLGPQRRPPVRALDLRRVPGPDAGGGARRPSAVRAGRGDSRPPAGGDGGSSSTSSTISMRTSCGAASQKRTSRTASESSRPAPTPSFMSWTSPTPLDADALEQPVSRTGRGALAEPRRRLRAGAVRQRALCFWQGKRYQLRESEPGPFASRADAALVVQGIADLMTMPSAGDLVIYGIDAPQGHVSFIPEMGAHAGPSPDELHTFIVRPAESNHTLAHQSSGPALRSLHPLSGAVMTWFVVASHNIRLGVGLDRRPDILRIAGDGLPRCGVHFAQIGLTEWTTGGKPRHPRFLGLWEDKRPEEVMDTGGLTVLFKETSSNRPP